MLWFDELYLAKTKLEGYDLLIYEYYVDDLNQGVKCENDKDEDVKIENLKAIADSILPGIIIEKEPAIRHEDKRLTILDMKCWNQDGFIVYQHFSKPT